MKRKYPGQAFIFCACLFLFLSTAAAGKENAPDRHYFERCTTQGIVKIAQGMTRQEARKACAGFEFPASESLDKGFVFTVDAKKTATARIPGWLPSGDQKIDFFCSRQVVVMAYYNKEDVVEFVTRFPMHQS